MLRNYTDLEVRVRDFANKVTNKDEGATMVEYALLVSLIAVFLIIAIGILAGKIDGTFRTAASKIN